MKTKKLMIIFFLGIALIFLARLSELVRNYVQT